MVLLANIRAGPEASKMSSTQVHIIDPSAALIMVLCADGSRVLFGTHAGGGTSNEIVQRLFEVLEDGSVDYLVHEGIEPQGTSIVEGLSEFFPIKTCLELEGEGFEIPQFYQYLRADREVETLEASDIFELGETQIRLLGAHVPHPESGSNSRAIAMLVTHGDGPTASSVLCCGATTGLDWLEIAKTLPADDYRAGCMIVDGRRPLDIVLTAPSRGHVTADHVRAIGASTIVLGADPDGASRLRLAARELYTHFAGLSEGGYDLVELNNRAWTALELNGTDVQIVREERPLSKVA